MKNTAKLKASVTHGARGSTHDAYASNDAQASNTMHKASRTMRSASSAMHKHPYDAQASKTISVEKVNDSDHNPVTSHHKKQHTQTQKCLAPVKTQRQNGTPSSQSITEPKL